MTMKYSEKENKLIQFIKNKRDKANEIMQSEDGYLYQLAFEQFDYYCGILNLIEKQQKEIEEQKSRNKKLNTLILDLNKALEDSISKEAVIEKIQEVKEEFDRVNTPDNNEWYIESEKYALVEEKLRELLGE